jgi:hypothetical protein
MSPVSEIGYSRNATVEAVRDYYQFLTSMYLDNSDIMEPPEGGWPSISPNGWKNFDKTDEVIQLLRHLPYMKSDIDVQHAPEITFIDWHSTLPDADGVGLKQLTEPYPDEADIPPHVVGLTVHTQYGPPLLLDTEFGVIYWYECWGQVQGSCPSGVEGDPYGWLDDGLITEDQVLWRASSGVWAIKELFEMLKYHFRMLNFVPMGSEGVKDVWVGKDEELQDEMAAVQEIYRRHGWSDMSRFHKEDCLAEVETLLEAERGYM